MFLFGVQKGGPIPIVANWKKESTVNKIHGARVEYTSKWLEIYYYIHREIYQILMDLDFHPLFQCRGKFYIYLFPNIHTLQLRKWLIVRVK